MDLNLIMEDITVYPRVEKEYPLHNIRFIVKTQEIPINVNS